MTFPTDKPSRKAWDDTYLVWFILAVPALLMIAKGALIGGKFAYLYWTGIISCWLMILAMMITPVSMIVGPLPWLKARRRYFGVASFAYACLHLAAWLVNANLGAFIRSFIRLEVLPGWIAFAIMIPLAVTSTDGWVSKMGPRWKPLQRWIYPAAVLTLIHWVMTTDYKPEAVIAVPLVLLSVYRVIRYRSRLKRR